ncbi:MAG: hypothetical protein H6839_01585 [Planctomycetes bacterium]|nr:hypothetical protein [Planctomycetota bacterium]
MKSVFRAATAALTVAGTLLIASLQPAAQDAELQAPPQQVTQSYNVRSLVQRELWHAPRTGAIGDVLAPDRLFFTGDGHAEDEWSLRDSGEEARCWDNSDDLGREILGLIENANEDVESDLYSEPGTFDVRANADIQKQVAWYLDALHDVAKARVSMVVYRLDDDVPLTTPSINASEVAGWTKGGRYVANFRGGLAEPFVVQQTQHRSYVADYDINLATEAAVESPNVRDLNTGEEFVLGAVSLSDGRLWLQGWHASMKLNQMRSLGTSAGDVELPDVSYSFAPVSAVIENGGAAIIDAGKAGRFLVKAECDRVIPNREMKLNNGTTLRLINCVGGMRGQNLGGFWLMRATAGTLAEDTMFPQVMLEDVVDGPYRDSALMYEDELDNEWFRARCFGPYLAVVLDSGEGLESDELAERDSLLKRLDAIPPAPETVGVRITAFEVSDDAALPAGVLNGRPATADVAELRALAGGKAAFDQVSSNMLRQQVDNLQVRLATHLRGYDSQSATGVTALDPQVGTLVLGEQIRWQARADEEGRLHIEVRSGITVGSTDFDKVEFGNNGLIIERSRSALAQARLADDLLVGERMASLTPAVGADGKLVVIVVERLK